MQEIMEVEVDYKKDIEKEFQLLLENAELDEPGDEDFIRKAFNYAREGHVDVKRNSGEPYIMHPLSVARVVSEEMKLDTLSIVAALLHDVLEDVEEATEDEMSRLFGNRVTEIVKGLTKIRDKELVRDPTVRSSKQATNYINLFSTLNTDVRVFYVKIADRLHNMRTLDGMRENKQIEKSAEVELIYAPLAHRLGMHNIRTELRNKSFWYLQRSAYNEIEYKLSVFQEEYQLILGDLAKRFENYFLPGEISNIKTFVRPISSIWSHMKEQKVEPTQVRNLLSIRIIIKNQDSVKADKAKIREISGRLDDHFHFNQTDKNWLTWPRSNGYTAMHYNYHFRDYNIDVQLMSERMVRIANFGYGKDTWHFNSKNKRTVLDDWLTDLKSIVNKAAESGEDPKETMQFIDKLLYVSDIRVLDKDNTPRFLPRGSTVLDFAFEIHTDLGLSCAGAEVNKERKSRDFVLHRDDHVKIVTSGIVHPDIEWYNHAKTAKAQHQLREWYKEEYREEIAKGKEIYAQILQSLDLKKANHNGELDVLLKALDVRFKYEFFVNLAQGIYTQEDIAPYLKKPVSKKRTGIFGSFGPQTPPIKEMDHKKIVQLDKNFNTQTNRIQTCCHPVPGDDASGYQEPSGIVHIHRSDCKFFIDFAGNSNFIPLKIDWESHAREHFLAKVEIHGKDTKGVLGDISQLISKNLNIDLRGICLKTTGNLFNGDITIQVHSYSELQKLMKKLRSINAVQSVNRVFHF